MLRLDGWIVVRATFVSWGLQVTLGHPYVLTGQRGGIIQQDAAGLSSQRHPNWTVQRGAPGAPQVSLETGFGAKIEWKQYTKPPGIVGAHLGWDWIELDWIELDWIQLG